MTAGRIVALACVAAFVGGGIAGAASSIGGARLVVYWSENPWPSIWAVRADGTQVHRILRNRQNGKRPRLSPDRRWVAFDGAPPGKPPLTDFDIQVVRPDGTGRRTITHGSMWDLDAQWSPDGRWLSFTRLPPHPSGDEHNGFVWIVRPNGTGLRRLARGFGARWSPDSTKLVYEAPSGPGSTSLSVIALAGGDSHALVTASGIEQPAGWSPDGKQILFNRYFTSGTAGMYVMNADGSDVRKLGNGIAAAWSPDGTKILYGSSFVSGLLVMDRDGSHRRRIGTVFGSEPDWR